LEYNLPDKPAKIHFAGCLPRGGFDRDFSFPSWWSDVANNSSKGIGRKKLIFICQGTVSRNWALLVEPAIQAFAGKDDVLVVASLGAKGSSLDPNITIPSNARVADYLPYDAVLHHADVFLSNGGYGAFSHAVMNGVPMVLAGETEEKPEVIMRAVYAGFGYSLKTQSPTAEMVKGGVEVVLADPRYKRRAVELREENMAMGALGRIRDKILELSEKL
jgi:UDP:flavonoid glycosyltransferase YjiC (YdhE family)